MGRMLRGALVGTAAGAAGTTALNATTFADMALRGRPASSIPAQVAGELAERAGVDLGSDETRQNRKCGRGALSGYVVGLGAGAAYGLVRPHLGRVSKMRTGVALGLGAMEGRNGRQRRSGRRARSNRPDHLGLQQLGLGHRSAPGLRSRDGGGVRGLHWLTVIGVRSWKGCWVG